NCGVRCSSRPTTRRPWPPSGSTRTAPHRGLTGWTRRLTRSMTTWSQPVRLAEDVDRDLDVLADLLRRRNEIDRIIAAHIGRPAQLGHLGEYIAERIFDIQLHVSAAHPDSDGVFRSGPTAKRPVNVKWYTRDEGLLDLSTRVLDDLLYLVLTGPR